MVAIILLAAWITIDINYPFKTDLGRLDAIETARLEGADTAAMIGMPAPNAFWTISNDARPLTRSTCFDNGSRFRRKLYPIALSTAL